jgi:uncharacterized OB-fold protein
MPASVEGFLMPAMVEEAAGFWEGTRVGELRMQSCSACGAMRFPPRPMCPRCRSTRRHWQAVSGRATLWSFVVPHPPLLPAYAELTPYLVVTVALEEDPTLRLVGNVLDTPDGPINQVDPTTLRIGEPLSAVFVTMVGQDGSEVAVPRWLRAS